MDPQRIHAYLQAACAGIGFDIGEVWFSSNDAGASTITTIERKSPGTASFSQKQRDIKFLQLYLSKTYKNRRNELLRPVSDTGGSDVKSNNAEGTKTENNSSEEIKKHVLSPKLVNAIASTAQVVWANCQEQEGLLGRSDMRLQTAVGMPVAVDVYGNMCIVVMFSPRNVQSTTDAIEYLKSLSQGATSTSIPCLLPVMDGRTRRLAYNAKDFRQWEEENETNKGYSTGIGETYDMEIQPFDKNNADILDDFTSDLFGIPLLPPFEEIEEESNQMNAYSSQVSRENMEANPFDHASYGLWSTIMQNPESPYMSESQNALSAVNDSHMHMKPNSQGHPNNVDDQVFSERRERLEEFATAFLEMSVFDLADCWMPSLDNTNPIPLLHNIFSLTSSENNSSYNYFMQASKSVLVQGWSGAVGNAFCSGNPIWSKNMEVTVDSGRVEAFAIANIKTVLAIPIFSEGHPTPSCVLCFYSLVRSDSVPFVMKFVQQALRSLWYGLDRLQPHKSIGEDLWKEVAPADLGEMAADLEMQSAFHMKKRPFDQISFSSLPEQVPSLRDQDQKDENILFEKMRSLSNSFGEVAVPLHLNQTAPVSNLNTELYPRANRNMLQNQMQQAIQSVAYAKPFSDYENLSSKRHQIVSNTSLSANQTSQNNESEKFIISGIPTSIESLKYCENVNRDDTYVQSESSNPTIQRDSFLYNHNLVSAAPVTDLVPSSEILPLSLACESIAKPSIQNTVKICRIQGCEEPCVSKRPYCSRHSGNRQCEHETCTKCAQGATRFCIAHGGGRRCTFPGCDKGARDKFFCAAHGGGKRCVTEGCKKSAVGGSNLCTSHGGGRRCTVDGCEKSAQSSTKFCVKHGGGKKCSHPGCEKVARGRTLYCAGHGGGIRCKLEGCTRIAIGKLQLCRAHGGGSKSKQVALVCESEEEE